MVPGMITPRRVFVSVALSLAMVLGGPAGAQLDATENPEKSGPLSRGGGGCTKEVARAPSGVRTAVLKSCGDVYVFNPAAETARRNFDVVWLQTEVNPENRFCAAYVKSKITLPRGYRIEQKTPTFRRISSPRGVLARIRVKARGTATERAVVKNRFRMYPRVLKPNIEGRRLIVEWRGRTRRTVAFAIGVEASYLGRPPKGDPAGKVVAKLSTNC